MRNEQSEDQLRTLQNAKRYQLKKQINKKFSNITLTKRDTNRVKLERTKASHSLDTGVRANSGNIYKPNFGLLKKNNTSRLR